MRIKVMDQVFSFSGLGEIVTRHVKNPQSAHITVQEIVNALSNEQKEAGVSILFNKCIDKFSTCDDEKRLDQLAECAFHSYKVLKTTTSNEKDTDEMKDRLQPMLKKAEKYTTLFQAIVGEDTDEFLLKVVQDTQAMPIVIEENNREFIPKEISEADSWFDTQKLTLPQIEKLVCDDEGIKVMQEMTKKYAKEYITENQLTTHEGKVKQAKKTLYGAPFDQNRLGKIGEKEVKYSNGTIVRKDVYHPGFEGFYIAGSKIEMPYGTYHLMQAPLVQHDDKVDTVIDFWDTIVVMNKSPIIVTVHDPKEKIQKHGYAQRAEYWNADRFKTPMQLRDDWELSRDGEDEVIARSADYEEKILVKRSFMAKNLTTHERHKITQFHYQDWPDHCGAPDHELLEKLHVAVDQEITQRGLTKETPITAHCAAGHSRSPVFAISHLLRRELLVRIGQGEKIDEINLDVAKTIYKFNNQRPSQLNGFDQWQSVFLSLRRVYLQQMGTLNSEVRSVEKQIELQTLKKAAEMLQEDIKKTETNKKI